MKPAPSLAFDDFKKLFERPVFQSAAKVLQDGVELAISHESQTWCLVKHGARLELLERPPETPDMTFEVPSGAFTALTEASETDVGEFGIVFIQHLSHLDSKKRIRVSVHISLLAFVLHGYLNVIPLGGAKVMGLLKSKGFGISQIRNLISSLRKQPPNNRK